MEAKPDKKGDNKVGEQSHDESGVRSAHKHSHHIKLLHGSRVFFFFFSRGKKERGLNRALVVDLKVCAGSSGRKSRPFKCD